MKLLKYKISSIVLTVVLAVFFIGVCLMIAITVGNTTEDSEKQEMSPELIFSEPAGFYGDSISLELSDKASQSDIYYTTDCSEPNADNGIYYESPIMLECKDTENVYTIRAALFNGDQRVTPVSTSTYILSRDVESRYTTLVISLVAPKTTLTDRITGIFSSRNLMIHGRKMERAASVEFFEPNGKLDVSQNIGVRVFGNYTRGLPLKSLKLAARKEYDDKGKFHFEPFVNLRGRTGNPIIEFDKLILRNSGNDFNMSMIRDAFGQQLGKSAGLDCQEYRPAVIYINGVYNGIINIREDENKDEIYSHYGIPSENVAVVSIDYNTKKYELSDGPPSELDNYENMLNFIKDRNMKVQENYEKAEEMLDIDSFIKYFAFEIYVANRDWPQNNLKAWRFVPTDSVPVDPDIYGMDGKWRFMLKDLDFGFSYYSETTEKANLFNVIGSVDEFGVGVMAGNLMKNPEFKNKFITYMSDILYDTGNPAKANDLLSRMQFSIAQEMQYNVKKWGSSIGLWNNQILSIKNFINRRPDNIIVQMEKYFKLSEPAIVNLVTTEGGSVQFSSVKIDLYNNYYNGKYFKNIPIPIKAVPDEGYIFQGFEVIGSSIENDS
ncbi:MAG: CotH kinase family protein, partial [Clostridiales bacterium]|nr:CotH kinase family protein [Clostridiales bacterium]